jgi:hypothetical protein
MLIKAGFRAKREAAVALSKGSVETAVSNATVYEGVQGYSTKEQSLLPTFLDAGDTRLLSVG